MSHSPFGRGSHGMQRFLNGKPITPPWSSLRTHGATITLNGGTVTDLAGGGLRVTIPGGAVSDDPSSQGVLLRWPAYRIDGPRLANDGADALGDPRLRIREIVPPGLSSDTFVRIGLIGSTTGFAQFWHSIGLHYSATKRAEAIQYRIAGAVTAAYNAAPTNNARGVRLEAEKTYDNTLIYRTWGAYAIDSNGGPLAFSESKRLTNGYLPVEDIDVFVAVGRTAATAGTETIDLYAEHLIQPRGR